MEQREWPSVGNYLNNHDTSTPFIVIQSFIKSNRAISDDLRNFSDVWFHEKSKAQIRVHNMISCDPIVLTVIITKRIFAYV